MTRKANKSNAIYVSQEGRLAPALGLLLVLALPTIAQDFPDKVRGYKVYQGKVSVNTQTETSDAAIHVGEPELVDVSLTGITLELPAEFTSANQSGKVDMITFHDMKVNGIEVEPEEHAHRFEFKKGEKVIVPKPLRIFVPASGVVKAAWQEMTDAQQEWIVTGRVLVFGKFRRYGFYHKRVVPVDFSLTIKNPLHRK